MSGTLLPIWRWQVLEDGVPSPGALLYTYLSGTSTPQAVYSDTIGTERTNPVVADADGVFPVIYLAALAYRMEVRNADGDVLYAAQDNITGVQGGIEQTTTATGAQANFALSVGDDIILRCTGAAPVFSGFAGGYAGRRLTIFCLGTTVEVQDQNGGSSAANQVVCPSASGLTIATNGRMDLVYDDTSNVWRASEMWIEATPYTAVEQTTTATGAQANFAPSAGDVVVIRCTGAAPVFSGFSGGVAARRLSLLCLGTSLRVLHQDGGSSAANQAICPSTNGLIVGLAGQIDLVYDDTTDRWRAFTVSAGAPLTPTFAAGDFTASAGNWTLTAPDVTTHAYSQVNKTLTVWLVVATTTVSTTPDYLRSAIPGGFTATKGAGSYAQIDDNAVAMAGVAAVDAAGTTIDYDIASGATFAAATNTTGVTATLTFEVD